MTEFTLCFDQDHWDKVIEEFPNRDFFYASQYHQHAPEMLTSDTNRAVLIIGADQHGVQFAMPMIHREIDERHFDLVSAYGYTGPLLKDPDSWEKWIPALRTFLSRQGCVSMFARLHPLLHSKCVDPEVRVAGKTISINLTDDEGSSLDAETRIKTYNGVTRRMIRQLRKKGAIVHFDQSEAARNQFAEVYYRAMGAMRAAPKYFFPSSFFKAIESIPSIEWTYARVEYQDRVVAAGLFTSCGQIAQYFLGGAIPETLHLSPLRLLLDAACDWAGESGAELLHLGGGRGSEEDGLFRFKKMFSDQTHSFQSLKSILQEDVYRELSAQRAEKIAGSKDAWQSVSFFPAYRAESTDFPQ